MKSPGELDLEIENMNTPEAEAEVGAILRDLNGVHAVRLSPGGAFVSYRPDAITHEQICMALRHAGFRASTFQDEPSGKLGSSSN